MASTKLRLIKGARDSESPAPPSAARRRAPVGERPSGEGASERQAMDALGDDRLVALAMRGDTRAAEYLYRRHAAFAYNLAARIAGSSHDVEDVVHDAFIKAFDNLAGLRNPAAFKTWLGSIVVHAMRSRLRRGRFLRFVGLGRTGDPVDIDCIANDEASPGVKAEIAQIYALLKTLSPDERIAWTLRYVEGHDLKSAAELCDCSLATVKRRIRRAQRYLQDHFVGATELLEKTRESVIPESVLRADGDPDEEEAV